MVISFLIQENIEPCLNYVWEMQGKWIHKASAVFVLWGGKSDHLKVLW